MGQILSMILLLHHDRARMDSEHVNSMLISRSFGCLQIVYEDESQTDTILS